MKGATVPSRGYPGISAGRHMLFFFLALLGIVSIEVHVLNFVLYFFWSCQKGKEGCSMVRYKLPLPIKCIFVTIISTNVHSRTKPETKRGELVYMYTSAIFLR